MKVFRYLFLLPFFFPFFVAQAECADLLGELKQIDSMINEKGEYEKGLAAAQRIAQLARKNQDYPALAKAYLVISDANLYLGRTDLHKIYSEKALKLYQNMGDSTGISSAYYLLSFYYFRNEPERMLSLLKQARPYAEEAKDLHLLMRIENASGLGYTNLSQYRKAIEHYRNAAEMVVKLGDEYRVGVVYHNIALSYDLLGNHLEALDYYRRALKIFERKQNKNAVGLATGNLGRVNHTLGNYEEALSCYEKAIAIHRELGYRMGELTELQLLSDLYDDLGEEKKAIETRGRALTIAQEIGDGPSIVGLSGSLAQQFLKSNHLKEAERYLKEAQAYALKAGGGSLLQSNNLEYARVKWKQNDPQATFLLLNQVESSARETGDLYFLAIYYATRAEILESMSQTREAISAYEHAVALHEQTHTMRDLHVWYGKLAELYAGAGSNEKAQEYYGKSLGHIDRLEALLVFDRFRIQLFQQVADIYRSYANWLASRGKIQQAWEILEQGRTRDLLLRLLQAKDRPDLTSGELDLLARISTFQRNLREKNVSLQERDRLLTNISDVEQEYESLHRSLLQGKKNKPSRTTPFHFPNGNSIFVEYALHSDELLVFSYRNGKTGFRKLKQAQQILQEVRYFAERVSRVGEEFDQTQTARRLFQQLLGPELQGVSTGRLILIPEGILYYLPFSALITQDGSFLAEKFIISITPSLNILNRLEQKSRNGGPILAVANTDFTKSKHFPVQLTSLPASAEEARMVSEHAKGSEVLINETEAKIKQTDLSRFRVIHFATHTLIDEIRPERSSIVMEADPTQDGFLQVREIYQMSLAAEMIVLSACRTGTGKLIAGEGMVGLSHALFTAGTKSLVLSLWDVSDTGTAQFMSSFYDSLIGSSIAEALQSAQKKMIHSSKWQHPGYWSAFVVSGDAEQKLHLEKSHKRIWIISAFVLTALFLRALLRKRRKQPI